MMSAPVVLRTAARRDIDEAVAYYLGEAGEAPALRFIDAVGKQFRAESVGWIDRKGTNGAEGQNRTGDTTIFSRMLYQLSYLGTK